VIRDIANAIAGTTLAAVRGEFYRHAWHSTRGQIACKSSPKREAPPR
jgi:hypothetical protein